MGVMLGADIEWVDMQVVAKAREARVSFISGDVHCAAIGRLYTRPKASMPHMPQNLKENLPK